MTSTVSPVAEPLDFPIAEARSERVQSVDRLDTPTVSHLDVHRRRLQVRVPQKRLRGAQVGGGRHEIVSARRGHPCR